MKTTLHKDDAGLLIVASTAYQGTNPAILRIALRANYIKQDGKGYAITTMGMARLCQLGIHAWTHNEGG